MTGTHFLYAQGICQPHSLYPGNNLKVVNDKSPFTGVPRSARESLAANSQSFTYM